MRTFALLCLLLTSTFAQTPAAKAAPKNPATSDSESPEMIAARHSFMLVSTRAVALFKSADTIEARLQAEGATLRPSTTTLRLRIEHTLDQVEADLDKGDVTKANGHIHIAEELVNRFARRIGGEY